VIDKNSGETVSEYVASKKVMTIRKAGGVELVSVEPRKQKEITLDAAERKELLDMALKVEEYFRSPQDLEWTFTEARFYLVQTRPITALYPMPQPEDPGDKLHIYMNMSLYSVGTHEPFTPLAVEIWKNTYKNIGRRINRKYYHEPVYWSKSAGGRLFLDITELIKLKQFQNKLVNDKKFDKDPVTIKLIMQLLERDKEKLRKPKTPFLKSIFNIISKVNPWFIKFIITSLPKIAYGVLFPNKAVNKAYLFGSTKIAKLEEERKKLQTIKEKLAFIERIGPENILFNSFEILFYGAVSLSYADKARKIINKHGLDASEVDKVERAVPNCVTTEMGMEMLQLAKQFDQTGEEPAPDHPDIKKFLLKYGHRANEEIDFGLPTWNEKPGYVVSLIRSYIENKTYQQGLEKFKQDMKEAEQAIERLTAQLKGKGARREAKKVEKWLRDHRKLFGIRELPKFMLLKTMSLVREILLEIGEELQAAGRLENRDDIFMVNTRDITSAELLHEKVRHNREEFLREMQRKTPRIMTSTGETFYSAMQDESDDPYRGVPVSPGDCEGTVKVLNHPHESDKLQQGDILVTTATNPAWTPLFLIIGGLIMETGGPISHGSVVAREYGIPAVVGVKDATARFKDGQKVSINGETGTIKILNGD
jgi:rifampicin phosphotransferase